MFTGQDYIPSAKVLVAIKHVSIPAGTPPQCLISPRIKRPQVPETRSHPVQTTRQAHSPPLSTASLRRPAERGRRRPRCCVVSPDLRLSVDMHCGDCRYRGQRLGIPAARRPRHSRGLKCPATAIGMCAEKSARRRVTWRHRAPIGPVSTVAITTSRE